MSPIRPAPLGAPAAPPLPPDPGVQLCAFYVGEEEYVVDIMRIEEILQVPKVTPVPRAPAFVVGVVNLRGLIVPVVELRQRLGSGPPRPRAKPKLLVCRIGRRRVGLLVDSVSEVVRVPKEEMKPAPGLSTSEAPAVIGVCGPPERLKLLLNLKAVLRDGPTPGQGD